MKKAKKFIIISVAIFMTVVTAVGISLKVAADSVPVYLKEIVTSNDVEGKGGKQWLIDNGYTVVDNPVSCVQQNYSKSNSDSQYNYAYLGYKTTTDKSEAITDIKLLHANSGYQNKTYRDMMVKWQPNIEELGKELKAACMEVKSKLDAGSELAAASKELLDLYDVEGTPLGDYLLNSARTESDYQDIVLICNSKVVNAIYSALSFGVADIGDDNFASRFSSQKSYDSMTSSEQEQADVDYWDSAVDLLSVVRTFASGYENGLLFLEDDEGNIDYSDVPETEDEIREYISEMDGQESDAAFDIIYVALYNNLNNYAIPSGLDVPVARRGADYSGNNNQNYRGFGDYLAGISDEQDSDAPIRYLYPLVSALSEGQLAIARIQGLVTLASTINANTEANRASISEKIEKARSEIAELEDKKDVVNGRLSVYVGVDKDVYDQQIAMTDTAIREADAGGRYDQLAKDSQLTAEVLSAIEYTAIIGLTALGVALVTMSITSLIAGLGGSITAMIGYAVIGGSWLVGSAAIGTLVVSIVGVALLAVAVIAIAVIVICAIIYWITKLVKDAEDHPDNVPIPNILYDCKDGKFIRYDYAKKSDGSPALLNGTSSYVSSSSSDDPGYYVSSVYAGWDVLYCTTSEDAGSPILVNNGTCFVQVMGNAVCPDNYMPLSRFGEVVATNLNGNGLYPGTNANYLYFATENSLAGKEGGSAEQNNLYLSALEVASNGDREMALLELKKKGYIPIDYDLTSTNDKYTFIGYKTTSNAEEAIKDIRVAYSYDADEPVFGNTNYANAGTTPNGATVYYSKIKASGSPIYADMCVFTDNNDAPDGWEPVNLFCGGEGFDFCIHQEWRNTWKKHAYLYFHPSEMYTSGTEYISGFAFFYGQKLEGVSLEDYMKSAGFQFTSYGSSSVCDGTEIIGDTEYFAYSTTYNPKRAITDIVVYSPSQTAYAASEMINIGGYTYTACETFMQYEEQKWTRNWRSMRKSNCYVTNQSSEGLVTIPEGFEDVKTNEYSYPSMRAKALYVCGPCSDKDPIKKSDFYVSTCETTKSGYRPVHEAWDYYATTATNLTQEYMPPRQNGSISSYSFIVRTKTVQHHLYMFIKGSAPEKGKYVESITIASSYVKNFSDDYAILTLLAQGNGEIIHTNLNRNTGNQWYNVDDNGFVTTKAVTGDSAYMLVKYTDTIKDSIRDITFQRVDSKDTTTDKTIVYNKVEYTKCGDIVNSSNGCYQLYTTTNGALGNAITDVYIDSSVPMSANHCTATDTSGKGNLKDVFYIHFVQDPSSDKPLYYYNLCAGSGDTEQAALKQLYVQGCKYFYTGINTANKSGKYQYIGYCTTKNNTNSEIICDIKFVDNTTMSKGDTYAVSSDYNYFSSNFKNLNLLASPVSPLFIKPVPLASIIRTTRQNDGPLTTGTTSTTHANDIYSDTYTVVTDDLYWGDDKFYISVLKSCDKQSPRGYITNLALADWEQDYVRTVVHLDTFASGAKDSTDEGIARIVTADSNKYFFTFNMLNKSGKTMYKITALNLASAFVNNHNFTVILIALIAMAGATMAAVIVTKRRKKGINIDNNVISCIVLLLTISIIVSLASCSKKIGEDTASTDKVETANVNSAPWEDSLGDMTTEESTTAFTTFEEAYKFGLQKELNELLYGDDNQKGEITSACVYDNDGDGTPCVIIFCKEVDGSESIIYYNFINKSLVKEKIIPDGNDGNEIIFVTGSDMFALRHTESDKSTQSVYELDDIWLGLYKQDTYELADAEGIMDSDLSLYSDKDAESFVPYSTVANLKNPVEYLESQLGITLQS